MKCRVCDVKIKSFMSFGKMPIANGFLFKKDFKNEYFYNLDTCFCLNCKTFQIKDQPEIKKMFHNKYPFFSSLSKYMIKHFKDTSDEIKKYYLNNKKSFIVELGSNDGVFLRNFKNKFNHLGIEPSNNVANLSKKNGINTLSKFFSLELSKKIVKEYGRADVIFLANVMCHLPNIKDVASGISYLLKENGVLIFEDPYLGDVIAKNSFDQIYDEHVFLFSGHSVKNIFSKHGIKLFKMKHLNTHGGSMRYYLIKKAKYPLSKNIKRHFQKEKLMKLNYKSTYLNFKNKCEKFKKNFKEILINLKKQNKIVIGYGATSKSTTILNYCSINDDLIKYIYDITKIKQNKYTPGSHIPVKKFNFNHNIKPDYYILFAWNHKKEILRKENLNKKFQVKWIIPFPFKS